MPKVTGTVWRSASTKPFVKMTEKLQPLSIKTVSTLYCMEEETRDKRVDQLVATSLKREEACYNRIGDKIWTMASTVVKRDKEQGGDIPIMVHVPKDSNASPGMVILCLRGCGGVWGGERDVNIIERWELFHRETKTAPCFISIGYRGAKDAKFPSQIFETTAVYDALQTPELVEVLGFTPTKVGLMGISTGGLFAAHAAAKLAEEGKPLEFLALHTPWICPLMLGHCGKNCTKATILNTLPAYTAYWCYAYLLGPHTDWAKELPIPKEEQFKAMSLVHGLPWETLKGLNVLFITAAQDFHIEHADDFEILLFEEGINFTRVDCQGFHALPEKLDETGEDSENIAVVNAWYQKQFGGGVAPPSRM